MLTVLQVGLLPACAGVKQARSTTSSGRSGPPNSVPDTNLLNKQILPTLASTPPRSISPTMVRRCLLRT